MRSEVQKRVLSAALCGITAAVLCACASTKTNLLQQEYVSLAPAESLSHPPEVYEDNGEFVVSGKLDSAEAINRGHVDVTVVGPDGTKVYEASVDFRKPRPQTTGTRGTVHASRTDLHATYSVRFPGLP